MFSPFAFMATKDNFDSDYNSILSYASTQGYTAPSSAQQEIQNQLITDLKTSGAWDGLEFFYVFATDGDRDFAKINWKNPGTYNATEISTPTFTTDIGFTGDGSSTALDTNYVPNTYSVVDDSAMGAWMDIDGTTTGTAIGSYSGIRTHIIHKWIDGNTYYNLDTTTNPALSPARTDDGLWHLQRNGGDVELYLNNSLTAQWAFGTNGFSAVSLTMLTRKRSNTPTYDGWGSSTIKMAFFGDRDSGIGMYTPFNDYLNAI